MLPFPDLDPVLFSIGPLAVRWYGLMYVLGFAATFLLVRYQAKQHQWRELMERMDNLNLSLILGVILGGRLGYVLFYNPIYYLRHPLEILATWNGGMSFHGGCLGALILGFLYCRRNDLDFWKAVDLYIVTVPIGLGLGRIGNFINGELFGRITSLPWGMVFPQAGSTPRHPSQLYEMLLEGVVLFVILWRARNRPWKKSNPAAWPSGSLLALFLGCYGLFRFLVEFVREPDVQIGYLSVGLTMGQTLSLSMILLGLVVWTWRRKTAAKP